MGLIPDSEQRRAQEVMRQVKAEMNFGRFHAPLPFIIKVARTLGGAWGLNGKRGDASTPSADVLAYRMGSSQPVLVDVLRDGGGDNELVWQELTYPQQFGAVWIDPTTFTAPNPPVPGPPGPTPPLPPPGGGGGGMPRLPSGLYPDAYKVAQVVMERLASLQVIPKGTDDGGNLPADTVAATRLAVAAIAAVACDWAIRVAERYTSGESESRAHTESELAELDARMGQIFDE